MQTYTRLSQALLQQGSPDEPAAVWTERLQEVGLLTWRPAAASDLAPSVWTPNQGICAVQESLSALRVAEVAVSDAREADPFNAIQVPDAIWWLIGGALLSLILFANQLVEVFGPNVVWAGIAFAAATAMYTVFDRRRRAAEIEAQQALDRARAAFFRAIHGLLSRNFVALHGDQLLVSTPDLDRLRTLEAALSLSDPDAQLLIEIRDHITVIEARIQALRSQPPVAWTDEGLSVDVAALEDAVDAL
ncbi:MAG: hypothetical protein AAFV53_30590 [Myxococcota bacterium]